MLPTNTFNSKVNELKNKIKIAESKPNISNLATKTEVTHVENKIHDFNAFVQKTDYATEISGIKNDYVLNAALASQLNDLKSQDIVDEVKKVDDKVKKNSSDILGFGNRLKQKEDLTTDLEREASFFRGIYYCGQKSYLLYECKAYSFKKDTNEKLTTWKSSGIDDYSVNSDLRAVSDGSSLLPSLNNDERMSVNFSGNYVKQNKIIHPNNKSVVNIYIVYKLDPISYSRNTDFTIRNALFSAVKITEDATDSYHNNYTGYGILVLALD